MWTSRSGAGNHLYNVGSNVILKKLNNVVSEHEGIHDLVDEDGVA